jgi:hypothetical protein
VFPKSSENRRGLCEYVLDGSDATLISFAARNDRLTEPFGPIPEFVPPSLIQTKERALQSALTGFVSHVVDSIVLPAALSDVTDRSRHWIEAF